MSLLWLSTAVAFCLSVVGKFLADHFLTHRIAVFGSFAGLDRSLNPGIAFSIMLPSGLQTPLITVALLLIVFLALQGRHSRIASVAFGLIIGGALANILDRVADGLVTDFIQVGTFPVFNIADSCITIGVVLLLVDMLMKKTSR